MWNPDLGNERYHCCGAYVYEKERRAVKSDSGSRLRSLKTKIIGDKGECYFDTGCRGLSYLLLWSYAPICGPPGT